MEPPIVRVAPKTASAPAKEPIAPPQAPRMSGQDIRDRAGQIFDKNNEVPSAARIWFDLIRTCCCICIAFVEVCQQCSKDCRTCCLGFTRIFKWSKTLYGLSVLLVFSAFFVIFVGWSVSSRYWQDDFADMDAALEHNVTVLNGTALRDAEAKLRAWRKRPIFRHFPMGIAHVMPMVIVSFAVFPFCCAVMQVSDVSSSDYFDDNSGRISRTIAGCFFGMSLCSFVFVISGIIWAGLLTVDLATTQYRERHSKEMLMIAYVPTVSCDLAVGLFVFAVSILYAAVWRSVVESRTPTDEPDNWRMD